MLMQLNVRKNITEPIYNIQTIDHIMLFIKFTKLPSTIFAVNESADLSNNKCSFTRVSAKWLAELTATAKLYVITITGIH